MNHGKGAEGEILEVRAGAPPHAIIFRVWDTANGIVGCLTGGDTPHVGGVVLAVPRTSLTGKGMSCDSWLIPVPGHKDLDVAAPLAKMLCKRFGVAVSLTAGIHIDRADSSDLEQLSANCVLAGEAMKQALERAKGGGERPR